MTTPGRPLHRESGFTLIELLIALVLLGFIATTGFGGLRLGLNALAKAPATSSEVPVLQRMLRTWLSQAAPILLGNGGPDSVVAFHGGPDRISWTGPLPERFAAPGLNRVSLALQTHEKESDVIVSWRPHRPDQPVDALDTTPAADESAGSTRPLLSRVSRLRFRYFGAVHDGASPDWTDRWDGQRTLPQMVEMSVEFTAEDRRVWPPMTVALRIDDTVTRGGRQ